VAKGHDEVSEMMQGLPCIISALHTLLSFDRSVHSLKMSTSHVSLLWKYVTVDVAYAFCVL